MRYKTKKPWRMWWLCQNGGRVVVLCSKERAENLLRYYQEWQPTYTWTIEHGR
jgi:hypothetical protein